MSFSYDEYLRLKRVFSPSYIINKVNYIIDTYFIDNETTEFNDDIMCMYLLMIEYIEELYKMAYITDNKYINKITEESYKKNIELMKNTRVFVLRVHMMQQKLLVSMENMYIVKNNLIDIYNETFNKNN